MGCALKRLKKGMQFIPPTKTIRTIVEQKAGRLERWET